MSDKNQTNNSPSTFFSIVIPVYNSGQVLEGCLKSILCQSWTDYEIIFADGASTDHTLAVIHDFQTANKQLRIKIFSKPDKGIYDAMNKAVAVARGRWLYFMGSDDRFHSPSVLRAVAGEIVKEPVDLIYGNVEGITSKTRYVYDSLAKVLAVGIHHQSAFYRATLFEELGEYDLNFEIASDYHFTLKIFLNKRYITKYFDMDIAYYGETGYSSHHFDYKLFSGHYRLIAAGGRVADLDDPQKCLNNSIYCCLYLAGQKRHLGTAWSNLLYYLAAVKQLKLSYRLRTALRMLMWTVKPLSQPGQ